MNYRFLLYPFAIIYFLVTAIRNWMFDNGLLKSTSFNFPVICVGNLSVGGTGKSPATNYLIDLLKPWHSIAVLSRGYGRRTKGFVLANENSTAAEIGDEPLMYFKRNHNSSTDVNVAVCESRVEGINTLKNKFHDLDIVLLDDAFQHRAVVAGLNILITDYSHLYSDDDLLPVGNLRESKSGAKRAQIVIVSKCPKDLSIDDKKNITAKLTKTENQQFFFSYMKYAELMNVLNPLTSESEGSSGSIGNVYSAAVPFRDRVRGGSEDNHWKNYDALLITGIAKPKPLKEYLAKHFKEVTHMVFSDHHDFTSDDLSNARKIFDNIASHKKIIITTEKDWMRIQHGKLKIVLNDLPVYVQPVSFEFNDEDKQYFNQLILNYVRENKTNR